MSRKKMIRFEANAAALNVVEPGKDNFGQLKGAWNTVQFGEELEIVLEIGCGHGDYTVEMARKFPNRNYVGIDIKGSRIWRGSKKALIENLNNVAFLRIGVQELYDHFAPGEVSEIWITFPDPRPKDRDIKRRLTSPRYLDLYEHLLRPGGLIHLKTDNQGFYEYTLEVLSERNQKNILHTPDLYNSPLLEQAHDIQTTYEKRYLAEGIPIKYLQFSPQAKINQSNAQVKFKQREVEATD